MYPLRPQKNVYIHIPICRNALFSQNLMLINKGTLRNITNPLAQLINKGTFRNITNPWHN